MSYEDTGKRPSALFCRYDTGTAFWRDTAVRYGVDEAITICGRYLDRQVKYELSDDEKRFCREVFATMYEDTAGKIIPSHLVYPFDYETAYERMEASHSIASRIANQTCARAVDTAIQASNYDTNYYNFDLAAMSVVAAHGFERVNAVLAYHIQSHENDGRYSPTNREWAQGFVLPEDAFALMNSHAVLINGFITHARKLYVDLGTERFALPGMEENDDTELVHGYKVIRSVMVGGDQGYAIAHNPEAVSPFVCWQYMIRDGERHYNWGQYGDYQYAVDSYKGRVYVALNETDMLC